MLPLDLDPRVRVREEAHLTASRRQGAGVDGQLEGADGESMASGQRGTGVDGEFRGADGESTGASQNCGDERTEAQVSPARFRRCSRRRFDCEKGGGEGFLRERECARFRLDHESMSKTHRVDGNSRGLSASRRRVTTSRWRARVRSRRVALVTARLTTGRGSRRRGR